MPKAVDGAPDRKLRIQRGDERYYVMESDFDTVAVRVEDGTAKTYKALGFSPVAELRNGQEYPYVARSAASVPGRQESAQAQVAALADLGLDAPAAVRRIAEPDADRKPESGEKSGKRSS